MGNENWFGEGFEAVRARAQQIEEARNQVYLPNFFLKDGEEASVTFLTVKPFTFYQHFLKGIDASFTCSQAADCPLCGIGNKPTFQGAYLIIDHRHEEWVDKQSGEKKSRQHTLKIAKYGIRALQVLDRKNQRKGLENFSWNVSRTGSGNDTQYDFEDVDKIAFPMPENIPALKDILKPREREYLLQKIASSGAGTPGLAKTNPINLGGDDENEGVISFK